MGIRFPVSLRAMSLRAIMMLPLAMVAAAVTVPASALEIELKGAAPDRIERQRLEAQDGPRLAGTPDLANFEGRLAAKGLKAGDHVFIRTFKSESELEVWMRRGDRYVKFATYPICFWSGDLGPKLAEGDKQTPEGFYTVTRRQLHLIGRWPRSLNLGFPNSFDKGHKRTGSYILIHGGCSSVGCYAMTTDALKEIYKLASTAIRRGGQRHVHVQAFPFRMTDANLAKHRDHRWIDFWRNLKAGYDAFEATRIPPRVGVCRKRYIFARAGADDAAKRGIRTLRPRKWPVDGALPAEDELACYRDPPATVSVGAGARQSAARLMGLRDRVR